MARPLHSSPLHDPSERSLAGARWVWRPVEEARLQAARHADLPEPLTRVLACRDLPDAAQVLSPSLDHLHDPGSMHGMAHALDRLRLAHRRGERVRVVTDYDVDGTTSSLILQAALQRVAPDIVLDYHIPDRFTEGYGFSSHAAEAAARDGVSLIVTADIGVRDHQAVRAARASDIDVLICDHHLPDGADTPRDAIALCPPQRECAYPNPHLAACGVSLKLAEALLEGDPQRDAFTRSLLKLAAIGTVADLVPLTTLENRAIVRHGLAQLNQGPHSPGLQALLDASGASPGQIDAQTIGFRIGPRINAAGRMAQATHVVELLTCRDPGRAQQLAGALDGFNKDRQAVQERLVDMVLERIGDDPAPFVVVGGEEAQGWHRGVVGIVAARVRDTLHRPVAVAAIAAGQAVGSVRSVPGVHAVHALDTASDLLVRYGGHPVAAGFSTRADDLEALQARLSDYVRSAHKDQEPTATREVDAPLSLDDLRPALWGAHAQLEPFGQANPRPLFHLPAIALHHLQAFGRDRKHLRCRLSDGTEVIGWSLAEWIPHLADQPRDLLVHLDTNHYRGRTSLRLQLVDAR